VVRRRGPEVTCSTWPHTVSRVLMKRAAAEGVPKERRQAREWGACHDTTGPQVASSGCPDACTAPANITGNRTLRSTPRRESGGSLFGSVGATSSVANRPAGRDKSEKQDYQTFCRRPAGPIRGGGCARVARGCSPVANPLKVAPAQACFLGCATVPFFWSRNIARFGHFLHTKTAQERRQGRETGVTPRGVRK